MTKVNSIKKNNIISNRHIKQLFRKIAKSAMIPKHIIEGILWHMLLYIHCLPK